MSMSTRRLMSVIFSGLFVIGLVGCDVDVKDEGKLPDVDVKGGEMPDVDVETPDVDVHAEEKEVTVPDVDVETEKTEVTVPDVDVTLPDENDNE